jgi:PAS domain S-box-containing protein
VAAYDDTSIVRQVLLPSVALVAVLLLGLGIVNVAHERSVWRSGVVRQLDLLSANVVFASESFYNPRSLVSYLEQLGNRSLFEHVVVVSGPQSEIIASTRLEEVGIPVAELSDEEFADALTSAIDGFDADIAERLLAKGFAVRPVELRFPEGMNAGAGAIRAGPSFIGFRINPSDAYGLPIELILVSAGGLLAALLCYRIILRRILTQRVLNPISGFAGAFEQHVVKPSVRIGTTGSLELDAVAQKINSTLETLETSNGTVRRLVKAIENVDEPVLITTSAGMITWVNRAFELHSGYSQHDMTEHSLEDLMRSPRNTTLAPVVWKEIRAGRQTMIRARLTGADGSERDLIARAYPLLSDSGTLDSVVIIGMFDPGRRDVERKAAELVTELQEQVASDLHDQIGGALGGILLRVRVLLDRLQGEQSVHAEEMHKLLSALGAVSNQSRTISHLLSPAGRNIGSLAAALKGLAESVTATAEGTCTSKAVEAFDELSLFRKQQIYLIAQEAVRNAVRHAGQGRKPRMRIRLLRISGCLVMQICSYGNPWSAKSSPRAGYGLRIMNYRAELIDSIVSVRTRPSGITLLKLTAPLIPQSASGLDARPFAASAT